MTTVTPRPPRPKVTYRDGWWVIDFPRTHPGPQWTGQWQARIWEEAMWAVYRWYRWDNPVGIGLWLLR